ncbi:hypothetical protein [Acinetobacter brisouii]|uniref:hypothetical protein n=1 Tax=Acinetobacter brisouii TaxID=396323 RepID=UPI0005F7A8B4|nr:hypothetical protein [Acinetobacter brisouii]
MAACQKAESDSTKTATATHATVPKPVDLATKCQTLDKQLKQFTQQGITPKQLIAFNTELKQCVTHVPLEQRYEWLDATSKLYQKFIGQYESQEIDEYFSHIIDEAWLDQNYESLSERNKIREEALEERKKIWGKLTKQQRFIIKNLKLLYLDDYYLGEGEFTLTQHPRYDVEMFASHLPEADQAYLKQNLNEYYGKNIDLDAGLSLSFKELAKRLLFWEKYQIQFPNSHFHKQVVHNIKEYRHFLLLGLENTPVIMGDYKFELADPEAIKAITQVSQANSTSSPIAQKFLQIIQQNQLAWQQLHTTENLDEEKQQNDKQVFFEQVTKQVRALVDQADSSTQ